MRRYGPLTINPFPVAIGQLFSPALKPPLERPTTGGIPHPQFRPSSPQLLTPEDEDLAGNLRLKRDHAGSHYGIPVVHPRLPSELDATVDSDVPTLPHKIPLQAGKWRWIFEQMKSNNI